MHDVSDAFNGSYKYFCNWNTFLSVNNKAFGFHGDETFMFIPQWLGSKRKKKKKNNVIFIFLIFVNDNSIERKK